HSSGESQSALHPKGRIAPPPVPADIGIVAALPIEVGYLIDSLRRLRKYHSATVTVIEGEYHKRIVALAIAGIGRPAARRAAEVLIAGHRPRWLISAGFAGALNPALARNDLVLPQEVIDQEGRRFPIVRPETLSVAMPCKSGRLLTVDRIIATS